jgi:hypothetical protein
MKKTFAIQLLVASMLFMPACSKNSGSGSGSNIYSGPNEPSSFTYSPIDISKISFLLSLGWIQPVGHTIPTDHVYFWYANTTSLPVYAPAPGKVEKILNVPVNGIKEVKTWFRVNEKFSYYLDHIVLDPSIQEGSTIKAGQQVGTTGIGSSIDLGAIDETLTLTGFANPARYAGQTLHCGKPFTYFTDALKTQLYPLVDREGSDKDGRIDIDVAGRLVGTWFLDGSTLYMDGPDGWDKELSFAFDIQHPATVLISIGGTIGLTGKWVYPSGPPAPSQVTVATGKVAYRLYGSLQNFAPNGLMIVQMMDDTHIKVEVFPGSIATDAAFDANAKIYAR